MVSSKQVSPGVNSLTLDQPLLQSAALLERYLLLSSATNCFQPVSSEYLNIAGLFAIGFVNSNTITALSPFDKSST